MRCIGAASLFGRVKAPRADSLLGLRQGAGESYCESSNLNTTRFDRLQQVLTSHDSWTHHVKSALVSVVIFLLWATGAFMLRCHNVRDVLVEGRIYFVDSDCYSR